MKIFKNDETIFKFKNNFATLINNCRLNNTHDLEFLLFTNLMIKKIFVTVEQDSPSK